jgi:predicted AAA+ superfamily ATPase
VATYVERDVRQLAAVRDLDTFSRFLRLCAARSGQVVNMSSLGSDAGVSSVTVKAWLSILRATYIVDFVEPYFVNLTTRLTKQPKLVFMDVGLMAYLLGIRDASQIASHPLRGALFETWGITEVLKSWRNAGIDTRLTYLRDDRGKEVDLVFERDRKFVAMEFKSGATVASDWTKTVDLWRARMKDVAWERPSVVYGGDESFDRGGVAMRGWTDFASQPIAGS